MERESFGWEREKVGAEVVLFNVEVIVLDLIFLL